MTIAINNIKRILRDRTNLLVMFVMPLIFMTFSIYALSGNQTLDLGIIDKDNTQLTRFMSERLSENYNLIRIDEAEKQEALINDRVGYIIEIDKGFTESIMRNQSAKLKTYRIKETNVTVPLRFYLQSMMNGIKTISQAAGGNEASFYRGLGYYRAGSFGADYNYIDNTGAVKDKTRACMGFLIMFMLYLAIDSSSMMLDDKELKIYSRILTAPVSLKSYMLQNILSYFVVMLLQVIALITIMLGVFKLDFGKSVFNIVLLMLVIAVTSVSFGVLINSLSKSSRQSGAMSTIFVIPLCMIGGCFWPREIMPGFLQQLSRFDPVSWALDGVDKLIYGGTLGSITVEIAVLLLFALAFFLMSATGRKKLSS